MTEPFDNPFVLHLAGPVALRRPDGQAIQLRSAKHLGLLALLATGRDQRRSRASLQDKLWSRSSPERAAASLRQALSGLRRQLGEASDILIATGRSIGLDPRRVVVSLEAPATALGGAAEFAEGLEIEDPEFEDWLRDRRVEFGQILDETGGPSIVAGAERPTIAALPPVCSADRLRPIAEILTSEIAAQIGGGAGVVVHTGPFSLASRDAVSVQVRAACRGAGARIQVELCAPVLRRILWIGSAHFSDVETEEGVSEALALEAHGAALRHLGRLSPAGLPSASHLPFQMRANFPFRGEDYDARIDEWLSRHALPENEAECLAWQARFRLARMLDGRADRRLRSEVRALGHAAMVRAPANPMVTAVAAEIALHLHQRPDVAVELARTSAASDPLNPIPQGILAQALLRLGAPEEGRRVARRALQCALAYPDRSWWHGICAAAERRLGNEAQARFHADAASGLPAGPAYP